MVHKQQKRGRPTKPDGEARTLSLPPIRVNGHELSFIEQQAATAGLPVSAYARSVLTQRRVAPARTEVDDKVLVELNRIGVNLNQLMRHVNAGRDMPASAENVLAELHIALTNVSAAYDT
jgi:hypothetical protein